MAQNIRITFACGHELILQATDQTRPVCPYCGEQGISDVKAPAPRIIVDGKEQTHGPAAR
jgi:hypothetical protein